jgi:hypothetical protein
MKKADDPIRIVSETPAESLSPTNPSPNARDARIVFRFPSGQTFEHPKLGANIKVAVRPRVGIFGIFEDENGAPVRIVPTQPAPSNDPRWSLGDDGKWTMPAPDARERTHSLSYDRATVPGLNAQFKPLETVPQWRRYDPNDPKTFPGNEP